MMSLRCVVFSVPFVFVAQIAWAVGGCPDYPGPAGQAITQYVSKNGEACEPGSYLKQNAQYDADFLTTVYGACERHLGYPSCPYYDTQYRYIGASTITEVGVSGWVVVYPNPNVQTSTLDTRGFNTSTPDIPRWTFYYEGERQLRSQSNLSTNCSSNVNSVETTKTFNVVKCEPFWWPDNMHLAPGVINIYLPSGSSYSAGLDAAITDWNNYLTGILLNRVTSPCTAGPYCVNVNTNPNLTRCGGFAGPGGLNASGEAQNPFIQINSNTTFSASGLQRTFAHELGHLLGLDQYLPCNQNDGVMQDQYSCSGTVNPYVKASDWLPVNKSVYANGTKNTCGW